MSLHLPLQVAHWLFEAYFEGVIFFDIDSHDSEYLKFHVF